MVKCGHCKDSGVSVDHVRGCSALPGATGATEWTVERVDDLLRQPASRFGDLLDSIAFCRGAQEWELRDRCITLALSSVTGEVRPYEWEPVVTQAAGRFVRGVEYSEVPERARHGARTFQKDATQLRKDVASEMRRVAKELHDIAITLTGSEAHGHVVSRPVVPVHLGHVAPPAPEEFGELDAELDDKIECERAARRRLTSVAA